MQKTPPRINPKKKTPPKVNPKLLAFQPGTWVELTETDRSFSCASQGQLGQVSAILGKGWYRLILKCGHIYETSKVRRHDGPPPNRFAAAEMSPLRMERRRRSRNANR